MLTLSVHYCIMAAGLPLFCTNLKPFWSQKTITRKKAIHAAWMASFSGSSAKTGCRLSTNTRPSNSMWDVFAPYPKWRLPKSHKNSFIEWSALIGSCSICENISSEEHLTMYYVDIKTDQMRHLPGELSWRERPSREHYDFVVGCRTPGPPGWDASAWGTRSGTRGLAWTTPGTTRGQSEKPAEIIINIYGGFYVIFWSWRRRIGSPIIEFSTYYVQRPWHVGFVYITLFLLWLL